MAKKSNLKIQNMVATASLNVKVPLVKLVQSQANTEYNPEQFPGLVYKPELDKGSRISFLLFTTGNFVSVGAKSEKEIETEIKKLVKRLKELKK